MSEILQKSLDGNKSTKTDPCGAPDGAHEPPTMPTGAEVVLRFEEDKSWEMPLWDGTTLHRIDIYIGNTHLGYVSINKESRDALIGTWIHSRPLGLVGARGEPSGSPVGAVSEDKKKELTTGTKTVGGGICNPK